VPTDEYFDIKDVPAKELQASKEFLVSYSSDQGHRIRIKDMVGSSEAITSIKRCMKKFKERGA
jgi:inorganic pyrophosphatase